MYLFKIPAIIEWLYPEATWHADRAEKKIFLTFDDGPVPGVTDHILSVLSEHNVRATFFCVGENIVKHPDTFQKILQEGHAVGNHTYNHLNGWKVGEEAYIENIRRCDEVINDAGYTGQYRLFRPPYGRIKRKTLRKLTNRYKVIMWDVLSYDFSHRIDAGTSLAKSIQYTRNGSIIIFHDSAKAFVKNKLIISQYIRYFKDKKYEFCNINELF